MLYETTKSPPDAGDLKYIVFLILHTMREEKLYRSQLLQATAALGAGSTGEGVSKELDKQFKKYLQAMYPYSKKHQEEKDKKDKQVLEDFTKTVFSVKIMKKRRF